MNFINLPQASTRLSSLPHSRFASTTPTVASSYASRFATQTPSLAQTFGTRYPTLQPQPQPTYLQNRYQFPGSSIYSSLQPQPTYLSSPSLRPLPTAPWASQRTPFGQTAGNEDNIRGIFDLSGATPRPVYPSLSGNGSLSGAGTCTPSLWTEAAPDYARMPGLSPWSSVSTNGAMLDQWCDAHARDAEQRSTVHLRNFDTQAARGEQLHSEGIRLYNSAARSVLNLQSQVSGLANNPHFASLRSSLVGLGTNINTARANEVEKTQSLKSANTAVRDQAELSRLMRDWRDGSLAVEDAMEMWDLFGQRTATGQNGQSYLAPLDRYMSLLRSRLTSRASF